MCSVAVNIVDLRLAQNCVHKVSTDVTSEVLSPGSGQWSVVGMMENFLVYNTDLKGIG